VRGVGIVAAVDLARDNDADGRLALFHRANLHRRATMEGLKLFDVDDKRLLPRIFCYFDDVLGGDVELYGDCTGERLAIHEFNAGHRDRQISPAYYLQAFGFQHWHYQTWILHNFRHVDYGKFVSEENPQLST
jgi:hypothetical protein